MTKAEEIRAIIDGAVETVSYIVELASLAEDLIDGMVPGLEFRMETIWEETTEALFKFTFQDDLQLFLSVYGPELDAYTYTVHVVSEPLKWLADKILNLKAEIEVRRVSLERAELTEAQLRGKVIKVTETNNGITIDYFTQWEFVDHYRQYYEGGRSWDNPDAEKYLKMVKAGEADGVENKWHTKMTAEWIGEEEPCQSSS